MKNNKKKAFVKVAGLLLAYAPIAMLNWGSALMIGEPKLPKHLDR